MVICARATVYGNFTPTPYCNPCIIDHKIFSIQGLFLNAFILLILYTIYSIPNYYVTMHVSFARVWNFTELEELEAESSFLEMYKPFSQKSWVVLNICILFTKGKSVKCPIDCIYIHATNSNRSPPFCDLKCIL